MRERRSPIGKFRVQTAARRLDRLRYVLFSCSSWGWGYFNAYAAAARLLDLDFTIALGDWIYEYSAAESPAPHEAVRAAAGVLQPPWETVSLADYRARHAFYRRDADVQALSAAAAMIAMWDDHEFAGEAHGPAAGALPRAACTSTTARLLPHCAHDCCPNGSPVFCPNRNHLPCLC